jgi:MutS domain V
MIVGKFVRDDLDLSGAVAFLKLKTKAGQDYALKRFDLPVDTVGSLEAIQRPIFTIRKAIRADPKLELRLDETLKRIATAEPAVNEITAALDKRIAESIEQVYWKPGAMGSFLNSWGFLIEFMLLWKTIFLPTFAFLTPFLVVVLPYVLIRTVFGISIPVSEYIGLLQKMMLSSVPKMPIGGDESSPISQLAKYAYILMSAGVFVSNIWTQIQAAIHLRSVAADIRERGNQLLEYVSAARSLAKLLGDGEGVAAADSVQFNEETFALGAYGLMYNESRALERLREWVAEQDLRISSARLKGICFPKAVKGDMFQMSIESLYHPGVSSGHRVLNDVVVDTHMLVTGPNRGGKSTLLKSVGLAIMTAQTWGIAWAKSMTFVPVVHFETALAPADTLGRLSLFEAEIEFAKHLLAISKKAAVEKQNAPVCIMMDEIFHSTNAHDGAEASLIFLKQLYATGPRVGSIVSTHYRELPDKMKDLAKTYCMEAFEKEEKLRYTYRCIPGISVLSSVREILKERGLLASENSTPESNEHP